MKESSNPTFALAPVQLPGGALNSGSAVTGLDFLPRPLQSFFEVSWAQHLDEVREAQRLRYQVFANELGARLPKSLPGHDIDLFDDYCEHLLVRDNASGQVIGTYRVLTPAQAKRAGSTYSDT